MKIKIETDKSLEKTEIIIKCKEITPDIEAIQQAVLNAVQKADVVFYKNNQEFYFNLDDVLFFETTDSKIQAHTVDDFYIVKQRLYELENILPRQFVRISKSTILNVNHVYSIEKNITASSLVHFKASLKQVYVSRSYYKDLKNRIAEIRKD